MASILVVCSGNICRSPIAEGLMRRAVADRFGAGAPAVSSAGTIGLEGSPATPDAVQAAAERGVVIGEHIARRLTNAMIAEANLVIGLAAEHRDAVAARVPAAADRAFTLKEMGRLLEWDAPASAKDADTLDARVAAAAATRTSGRAINTYDEDVVDPLGMPIETYRAIAWEIDEWTNRVVAGLFGPAPAREQGAS
jgi:protein-tyrosine phosphatase